MIALFVALVFSIVAFIKFAAMPAIISSAVFIGFALALNFYLRPKGDAANFVGDDYILQDEFPLYELEDGSFIKEIKSRTGKDIVLFKSKGKKDLEINIRRLPRENVRLIYSKDDVIKLYVAKKIVRNLPYSIFSEKYVDLGAEILAEDEICKKYSDKTYHN